MQPFSFEHLSLETNAKDSVGAQGFLPSSNVTRTSVTSAITSINIIKLIKWYTGEIRKYSPSVSHLRFVKILTISLAERQDEGNC